MIFFYVVPRLSLALGLWMNEEPLIYFRKVLTVLVLTAETR